MKKLYHSSCPSLLFRLMLFNSQITKKPTDRKWKGLVLKEEKDKKKNEKEFPNCLLLNTYPVLFLLFFKSYYLFFRIHRETHLLEDRLCRMKREALVKRNKQI